MIDVLQFIFQDFWHWLGTVILVAIIPMPFRFFIEKNNKNKKDD